MINQINNHTDHQYRTLTETAAALQSGLHTRYSKLVFPRVNLVDKVWKTRPAKPQGEAFFLDAKFTGT